MLDLSLPDFLEDFQDFFLEEEKKKIPACHKPSAKLKGVTFEEMLMQLLKLFKRKQMLSNIEGSSLLL